MGLSGPWGPRPARRVYVARDGGLASASKGGDGAEAGTGLILHPDRGVGVGIHDQARPFCR